MADFPLARTRNMARKQFAHHEAVSAVVPGEGGYSAAVAVKALDGMGAPQFHKILDGQKFKTAPGSHIGLSSLLISIPINEADTS
ncbi:hypothetical protein [Pseudomonas tolaasii]|uniref:hypothetical protein n=1 Tax=Pseudomonas tolaasii TaxID=29442 RepID=UPI00214D0BA6|nr:hypothetical protein [Pseudomonas tolaasii]